MKYFRLAQFFPKTAWLIILSTFMSRFTFFMIWPFMAIILYQRFGFNEFEIGIFLTSAGAIGTISGTFTGNFSDRFGRRKVIIVGLLVQIAGMTTLGFANMVWLMFVGAVMQAIARGAIENPGKALMTDMIEDRDTKDFALQMRYFALNVGAAFGPLLGVYMGTTGQDTTFYIVAATYAIYLCAALYVFNLEKPTKRTKMATDHSFKTVFNLLRRDHAYLIFLLASFFSYISYAQMEVSFLQYLRVENVPEVASLFATLIFINGFTIIVFQFPVMALFEKVKPFNRASFGVALFALGHLIFAFSPPTVAYLLYAGFFILSLGEVLLFPTLGILIDHMAPEQHKGSYYGASYLSGFGFAFAPLIGGFMLHQYGGFTLWMTMVVLSLMVAVMIKFAQNAKRPDFEAELDV